MQNRTLLDTQRAERTGLHEAVFSLDKSVEDLEIIIESGITNNQKLFFTRLEKGTFDKLSGKLRNRLDYDEISKTAILGCMSLKYLPAKICVVTGGTSDIKVASEAVRTLNFHGFHAAMITDVGVAGLWRLQTSIEELRKFPIIIVIAGMEAALPTVLSGLVKSTIIAVPVSTGYGVSDQGKTALFSMLTSCGQGISVVNIDNGFGAACVAIRIINSFKG